VLPAQVLSMPHRFVDFICFLLQTKQQLKALKAKQV
jgi:hypothetical protein